MLRWFVVSRKDAPEWAIQAVWLLGNQSPHLRELRAQRLVIDVIMQVLDVQVHALVLRDALRAQFFKPSTHTMQTNDSVGNADYSKKAHAHAGACGSKGSLGTQHGLTLRLLLGTADKQLLASYVLACRDRRERC
jgi:hypothetical protein